MCLKVRHASESHGESKIFVFHLKMKIEKNKKFEKKIEEQKKRLLKEVFK